MFSIRAKSGELLREGATWEDVHEWWVKAYSEDNEPIVMRNGIELTQDEVDKVQLEFYDRIPEYYDWDDDLIKYGWSKILGDKEPEVAKKNPWITDEQRAEIKYW